MPTYFRAVFTAVMLAGLAPAVADAATLAEAVAHWTGRTPDVFGRGAEVTIDLAPPGRVPPLTAAAHAGALRGDPGWQLSDLAVVQPVHLADGGRLTARQQQGSAWLGESTMQAEATFAGLTLTTRNGTAMLDRAAVQLTGSTGPGAIALTLDGLHTGAKDNTLLPRHVAVRAHVNQGGARALAALLAGQAPSAGTVIVDQADVAIGPAQFDATGSVSIVGPHDRHGALMIVATGFKELLRQMPTAGPAVAAYPMLMMLRQIGHKEAGGMSWNVVFDGDKVLVEGLDIGPLLGQ